MLPQTEYIIEALKILTPTEQGLNEADISKVINLLEDALSEDCEA